MKHILTVLLVFAPAIAFANFSDVPESHPNLDAITWAQSEEFAQGYSDGTFKPDATLNRAEFVTIMHRLFDKRLAEEPAYEYWEDSMCIAVSADNTLMPYSDVQSEDEWYFWSVCRATSQGWVQGYSDGTFKPNNTINFAEAAKIVASFYADTTIPTDKEVEWYQPYFNYLQAKNSLLDLEANVAITRGQMVEMLYRIHLNNQSAESSTDTTTEAGCLQAGGTWGMYGLSSAPSCIVPTNDAGKSCTDSSDCEERCISTELSAQPGSSTTGTCQQTKPQFGCYALVEAGKVGPALCVD